ARKGDVSGTGRLEDQRSIQADRREGVGATSVVGGDAVVRGVDAEVQEGNERQIDEAARVEAEPGFVAADRGNEMPEADVRERSGTNDFADARPQPGDAAVDLWTEVPGEIMERKPELGRERQQRNVKLLSQPDAEAASGISPRVQGDSEVEIGADGRS